MDMVISKHPDLVRVRSVQPRTGFQVHVVFTDGTERDIDFGPYLKGPIFAPVRRDPAMFRRIFVDHGAPAWPNGADIDPDTLYYSGPPPWAQDETGTQPKRVTRAVRLRARRFNARTRAAVR
jgi:hypothetical protein